MKLIQLVRSTYPENRYDFCILTEERYHYLDGYIIFQPQRDYSVALDTSCQLILERV